MKNIALVAHTPNSGGAARMLSHLATGLSRSKTLKPTVILGDGEKSSVDFSSAGISHSFGPTGNTYIVQQSSSFPVFAKRSLQNAARYVELFFRSRADIVLINTLSNYDAILGARMAQLPYVVWIHGIIGGAVHHFDELKPIIDAAILRNASGLVCCSDWTANYFKNLPYPCRLVTIPNWTNIPSLPSATIQRDLHRLALLCSLEDHKGVDTAIWAIALLKRDNVNVHLDIYGDGPKKKELEEIVRALKLKDTVQFHGRTNDPLSAYQSSLATLITSTVEAFGMTAIESMAAETLVIATRAGGLPDIINNGVTGLLFDTGDSADLARKILFAIKNPDDASKIAASGRRSVEEKFDGRESLAKFEDYLLSCTNGFTGYPTEIDHDLNYLRVAARSDATVNDPYIWQHTRNLEQELAEMRASTSWRLSAPIRLAGRFFSRKHKAKMREMK